MMQKMVSITDFMDAKKVTASYGLRTARMSYKDLRDEYPDIDEGSLEKTFSLPHVKHIVLFFYTNKSGQNRRKIVCLGEVLNSKEVMGCVSALAQDIGYDIERYLEIIK